MGGLNHVPHVHAHTSTTRGRHIVELDTHTHTHTHTNIHKNSDFLIVMICVGLARSLSILITVYIHTYTLHVCIHFMHKSLQNYSDFAWTLTQLNGDINYSFMAVRLTIRKPGPHNGHGSVGPFK